MEKPFTRVGKQIMASGSHYADAADETAAQFMLDALNTKAFGITESLLVALTECRRVLLDRIPRLGPEGPKTLEEQAEYEEVGGAWSVADRAIARATGAGA